MLRYAGSVIRHTVTAREAGVASRITALLRHYTACNLGQLRLESTHTMEAPRSSTNVIDMAARGQGIPHPAPFAEVRSIAFRRLPALVAEVLDRADDALFDFVQRSKSSTEQQDFFDAMRELRRQRSNVEQRYRECLAESFAALEKRRSPRLAFSASSQASMV